MVLIITDGADVHAADTHAHVHDDADVDAAAHAQRITRCCPTHRACGK